MKNFLNRSDIVSVLHSLEVGWHQFVHSLMQVAVHPDFSNFLRTYRGVPEPESIPTSREKVAGQVSHEAQHLIVNTLASFNFGANETSWDGFDQVLRLCEGSINLLLYFWHATEERNFQFRTVVHFTSLGEEPIRVEDPRLPCFFIRISAWGIQLSRDLNFKPFPFRFSLERACNLNTLSWENNSEKARAAETLAKIRVIQREFCQLIDEWEHCNALLAVSQFELRKHSTLSKSSSQFKLAEILQSRDLLATWCARSTADFQEHISNGFEFGQLHSDVQAELEATDALLLAGFQKFLLPASVSRHIYSREVIIEFQRYTKERLRAHPNDVFSLLANAAFSLALRENVNWMDIALLIEKKSYEWFLCADPSSAIRSVAWSFSRIEHRLLTALLTISLHAKRSPNLMETFWLQTLSSVIEMPSTFATLSQSQNENSLDSMDFDSIFHSAMKCLSHFASDSLEENITLHNFVVDFLNDSR